VIGFFDTYRQLYPVSRDTLRGIADRFQQWLKSWSAKRARARRGRRGAEGANTARTYERASAARPLRDWGRQACDEAADVVAGEGGFQKVDLMDHGSLYETGSFFGQELQGLRARAAGKSNRERDRP
jgi:hypothetical protein